MPTKRSPSAQTDADPATSARARRRALLVFAALIFVWGVNWPFMKMLLTQFTPLWFAVARMGLGAVTVFAILAARGRIAVPARQDLPVLASISLLQMAGFVGLISLGLHLVPAGRSAILSYTMPLWVAPGAALFLGERFSAMRALGLTLGMSGIALMFNPLDFDWSSDAALLGNGCLLLGAAAWAASILHVRAHRWRGTPLTLAPWQLSVAFVLLIGPAWLVEGPPVWPEPSWALLGIAFYIGPVITAFPFWASMTVARALPALTTSLGLLLTPVVGVLSAVIVLGETVTLPVFAGLVLILAGVATLTRPASVAAPKGDPA